MSNGPTALPLQMVCEMARSLPCSPRLLPQLMGMLKDQNASAQDIEALIRRDPGLAAATLRLANSAYFSAARACDSLSEAIVRLGNREMYKLAVSSLAARWLTNDVQGYGWEPGDLCRHSVCVAVAAQLLAREKLADQVDISYTAGLFHDVGKLALAYACGDQFEAVRQLQQSTGISWRQAERDTMGYDHTDIGGAMMESWGFPVSLVEVVLYYPRPKLAAETHRPLVTLIHAAKHLAILLGPGVGEDGFTTEMDGESLAAYGYTPDYLESVMPKLLVDAEKLMGSDWRFHNLDTAQHSGGNSSSSKSRS
jgi:putative nucleotidyltransferase with HDIG domain